MTGPADEQWFARHVTYTRGGVSTARTTEEGVFLSWLEELPRLLDHPTVVSVSLHTGALVWSPDMTPRIADEIARRAASEDKP